MNTKIRAISEDFDGNIAIGTRGGEIIECNIKNNEKMSFMMRGHYTYDLNGLDVNPNK